MDIDVNKFRAVLRTLVAKKLPKKKFTPPKKIENTYDMLMAADKNGAIKQLLVDFPKIFEGILRNYPEVLFQGLEDLDESQLPNYETVYFMTTPDAVWIVDQNGKIIGEEESGFADLKYTKYNSVIIDIIKNARSLI